MERLDVLLVKNNIFTSRQKAKESILRGEIYVDGIKIVKCSKKIKNDAKIVFKGDKPKYVSRGGEKLEKALKSFNIDLKDKICMDIGASTGGFTDCMLQNGAKKVWAIDVGSGQMNEKLKNDKRVINLEKTNIKHLKTQYINELIDFASIDVSFISLEKVVIHVLKFLKDDASVVALIKPQFEAGRCNIGKNGIVKKKQVHIEVIKNIRNFLEDIHNKVINLEYSPIRGGKGNIEYLIYFTKKDSQESILTDKKIKMTVEEAFSNLI